MGGWAQSIAQTAGGAGNDYGRAVDVNLDTALKVIQQKLMMQEVQSRMREQDVRIKQMETPKFATFGTPGGGTSGVMTDPFSNAPIGKPQTLVEGQNIAKTLDQQWIDSITAEQGHPPSSKQVSEHYEQLRGDPIKRLLQAAVSAQESGDSQQAQELFNLAEKASTAKKGTPELKKDDRYIAIMSKPRNTWTPAEAAFVKGFDAWVDLTKVRPGVARMAVLMNTREFPAILNGTLQYVTPAQIAASQAAGTPASPAGPSVQAMGKEAVFKDIHYNVDQTRKALNSLGGDEGFSSTQRAQLAYALTAQDRPGAMNAFLQSSAGQALSESQVNYITALASLNENAMALRSIGGFGQGSDDLRAAIRNAIPGAGTPTKQYGNRQLDLFEGTVNRLQTAVPKFSGDMPKRRVIDLTK